MLTELPWKWTLFMLTSILLVSCSGLDKRKAANEGEGMENKIVVTDELLKDLVCVAIFGSNDVTTRGIIEKELSAARVVHYIEGSVVYNVLVFKQEAKRAIELLRNSKALKNRWHQLME